MATKTNNQFPAKEDRRRVTVQLRQYFAELKRNLEADAEAFYRRALEQATQHADQSRGG